MPGALPQNQVLFAVLRQVITVRSHLGAYTAGTEHLRV